jgi:hypothetical protein
MLIPWDQEYILEMSKLQENVLGSKPCEGGFCSLETKHDRRTVQRAKLFVSAGDHRNWGHKPENCPGLESR